MNFLVLRAQTMRIQQKRPQLILVLLRDKSADRYREVKKAGDTHVGIITQCFVMKSAGIGIPLAKSRDQYLANLALKACHPPPPGFDRQVLCPYVAPRRMQVNAESQSKHAHGNA
jgi:hypothetical protein